MIFWSKHEPSVMRGFHDRWMGVHATKGSRAVTPMARFMDTMMYQTTHLVQPSVRRSRVTAKLVLDQMAAQMEKTPEAEMMGIRGTRSKNLKSHACAP